MREFLKRSISFLLCLALILPTLLISVSAEGGAVPANSGSSNSGTTPSVGEWSTTDNGIKYSIARKLSYLGGRDYRLDLTVSTDINSSYAAPVRVAAEHGYEVVQNTGWYLLELWGGEGGDGADNVDELLDQVIFYGGDGGTSGYLCAMVYLERGQVLVHSIGTNGGQSAQHEDGGGGVNGDGGDHGSTGNKTVGGGGGFSVFYLIDGEEFEYDVINASDPSWITSENVNLPEEIRTSRYIMIAGGGGGGGAAPSLSLLGGDSVQAPHGGRGGNSTTSYLTLAGSDYDVEGYVFAGTDGRSSGSSTSYVGRGGSNVPGAVVSSLLGGTSSTTQPNDWTGTYSTVNSYGAGGSGNLRGGGGGSGFCGGSGGMMTGELSGSNVGGGGGGSSFLASTVNGHTVIFGSNIPEDIRANYVEGINDQPAGVGIGGACQITYLGTTEDDFIDMSSFEDITLDTLISKYFTINEDSITVSDADAVKTLTEEDNGTKLAVSGISATPRTSSTAASAVTLSFTFSAKTDFKGGNAVNAVVGIDMSITDPLGSGETLVFTADSDVSLDDVNVPLNFAAKGRSHSSDTVGQSYSLSSLYTDDYSSVRGSLSSYPMYDWIESISTYSVYIKGSDTAITSSTVAPTVNTLYEVRFTVTVKDTANDAVTVGPVASLVNTYSAISAIGVITPGQAELNGLSMTTNKMLDYVGGIYTHSLTINQNTKGFSLLGDSGTYTVNATTNAGQTSYAVPTTGWYYIQAWGGNGGSGGGATIKDTRSSKPAFTKTVSGASGGAGAHVGAYVYLTEGQTLTFSCGSAGNSGTRGYKETSSSWSTIYASGTGGLGGNPTSVEINGAAIIIAGGGGGGGGSSVCDTSSFFVANSGFDSSKIGNGTKGTTSNVISSTLADSYVGGIGGNASASGTTAPTESATGGYAGKGAASYRNPAYGTIQSGQTLSAAAYDLADQLAPTSKTGIDGQVSITLIETPEMVAERNKLNDLQAEIAISKYFDIDLTKTNAVEMITEYGGTLSRTNLSDTSFKVTYTNSSYGGVVAEFTYTVERRADGSMLIKMTDCSYNADYTISSDNFLTYKSNIKFKILLTPKDGFLGGNDVPILASAIDGQTDTQTEPNADNAIRVSQPSARANAVGGYETFNVPKISGTVAADYANVAVSYDVTDGFETFDQQISYGDSLTIGALYTFKAPDVSGANAWKADYVNITNTDVNEVIAPVATTEYTLEFAISAKGVPALATAGSVVTEVKASGIATVYVDLSVDYVMTNLTHDGESTIAYGSALTFKLTADSGYLLPDSIEVKDIDGNDVDHTYNKTNGTVTVSALSKPITVTAAAKIRKYVIHYIYESDVNGTRAAYDDPVEYEAGAPISCDDIMASLTPSAAKTGYEYRWTADTDSETVPDVMPASDLWIYGKYEKVSRYLTVNYQYADGTEAAASHIEKVLYEDSYSVPSPAIFGYLADRPVVSGTMGASDVTVTVTYTASQNQLLIIYVKPNGDELARDSYTVNTDAVYSYAARSFTGYTPNVSAIAGTMPGSDSVTVIVECTPNTYNLTFNYKGGYAGYSETDFSSATLDGGEGRSIEFENVYSYDPALGEYTGLPKPVVLGFTFEGWYSDPSFAEETRVEDDTRIDEAGDKLLYAKWKAQEYMLTVRYTFIYTEGDFLPDGKTASDIQNVELVEYSQMIEYGSSYLINPNNYEGYTPYTRYGMIDQTSIIVGGAAVLTGTMPATSKVINVTYTINVYSVRFEDAGNGYIDYSDAATVDATVNNDNFTTLWQITDLKHGVDVAYGEEAPSKAVREEYTYTFTGWISSTTDIVYSGAYPDLPAATEDVTYYAMYDADENIVELTASNTVNYFTSVAEAIEYTRANLSGSVTMKLRRNLGNPTELDLTADPIAFNTAAASAVALTLDINGLRVYSEGGVTTVYNAASSNFTLTFKDSSATAGSIESINSTGDAVAIESNYGVVTISSPITIYAKAPNGTATAVIYDGNTLICPSSSANKASFVAEGKNAVGIDSKREYLYLYYSQVTVNGTESAVGISNPISVSVYAGNKITVTSDGTAIGIWAKTDTLNMTNYTYDITVNGGTSAIGIKVESGATLSFSNTTRMSDYAITVTSANGNAYGVYNDGKISSFGAHLNVSGKNAYGIYNNGSITVANIKSYADIKASAASGEGIALINMSANAIGTASSPLTKGYYYGSTYAIAGSGAKVYISGNDLYFKNSTNSDFFSNVETAADYQITIADPQAIYTDYYRLARLHTITFVTGSGTPIASITQFYKTELTVPETTLFGYALKGWFREETYTNEWTVPAYMPDETLTVYAKWEIITFVYTLDAADTAYTLTMYGSTSGSWTTAVYTAELTAHDLVLPDKIKTENMTYRSSNILYVHTGWYTASSGGERVDLSGDITKYADADGNIKLYSHWQQISSVHSSDSSYDYLTGDPTGILVDSDKHWSYNAYLYFVVQKDGDYSVSYCNQASGTSSSYSKYLGITKYSNGSTTTIKDRAAFAASSTYTTTASVSCKAGDVIVIRSDSYSSSRTYNSYIYAYINSDIDFENLPSYTVHSAKYNYNVDMGTAALPEYTNLDKPGYKFYGWTAEGVDGNVMTVTNDMINTTAWSLNEPLHLTSVWVEKDWTEYSSEGRDFTRFETTDTLTVKNTGSISFRFNTATAPDKTMSLKFDTGLPSGTILTLVDLSDTAAVYYSYTVTQDMLTELSLASFKNMATGAACSAKATDFILQICYQNTDSSITEEVIHLFYDGVEIPEADIVYGLFDIPSYTASLPSDSFAYSDTKTYDEGYSFSGDVVNALLKLDATDKIVIVIDFNGNRVTEGISYKVNGAEGVMYDGKFMAIDTGLTAGDASTSTTFSLSYLFDTMKFNLIENATFNYRLCVIPAEDFGDYSVFSREMDVIYDYSQTVTVTETPTVSADKLNFAASAGEEVSITFDYEDATAEDGTALEPSLYVYSVVNGIPVVNDAAKSFFDGLTVGDDGLVTSDVGVIAQKTFTATVSADAVTGYYCLKLVYADKYVYITILVS